MYFRLHTVGSECCTVKMFITAKETFVQKCFTFPSSFTVYKQFFVLEISFFGCYKLSSKQISCVTELTGFIQPSSMLKNFFLLCMTSHFYFSTTPLELRPDDNNYNFNLGICISHVKKKETI